MQIENLKKLKKDEIIEKYKQLLEEYEDLEQRYDDLDDCYAELENNQEEVKDLEEIETEIRADVIEKLLKDMRFSTELQNRLFPIFKDYFLELANFYCVDLPDEIHNAEFNDSKLSDKVYSVIEDYIDNYTRWDNV